MEPRRDDAGRASGDSFRDLGQRPVLARRLSRCALPDSRALSTSWPARALYFMITLIIILKVSEI